MPDPPPSGGVYLVLGDLKEAIVLVAFATMSVVITVVQESQTERVLEAGTGRCGARGKSQPADG